MSVATPSLRLERRLLRERPLLFACDEVGRGALAGPVTVGASVIDERAARRRVPEGLRDSKLVPEPRRPEVAERAAAWVLGSAVGSVTAAEIDEIGIIRALGLAAIRALSELEATGFDVASGTVLLDGNHDYISAAGATGMDVRTVVKGDRDCAAISAASVIAKVSRDAHMTELHERHPAYEWAQNKGYASAAHRAAIREHGLCGHHRRSWAIADAPTLF